MRKLLVFAAGLSVAFVVAGCSNTARFSYSAAPGAMPEFTPLPGAPTVGVMPAEDLRDVSTYADGDNSNEFYGSYYLGLIPFFPFGWRSMRHPEQSGEFATLSQFDFSPAEDLADASVQSLRASRLFAKVERIRDPGKSDCTYLWRTKLRGSRYRGYILTYCVTYFVAPLLWVVGFPDAISSEDLKVDFELVDRASGQVVWKRSHDLSDSMLHWIYTRIGADANLYAMMMKYALGSSLAELSAGIPAPAAETAAETAK